MKEYRNPATVHAPVGAYTHQIELSHQERLLVISGQIGMTPVGDIPEDPIAQIDIAFENLFRNLEAAGMGVEDIVKITFYLVGEIDTAQRRQVMAKWLQGHKPCTTVVFVAGLASPKYRLELDAWASRQA